MAGSWPESRGSSASGGAWLGATTPGSGTSGATVTAGAEPMGMLTVVGMVTVAGTVTMPGGAAVAAGAGAALLAVVGAGEAGWRRTTHNSTRALTPSNTARPTAHQGKRRRGAATFTSNNAGADWR